MRNRRRWRRAQFLIASLSLAIGGCSCESRLVVAPGVLLSEPAELDFGAVFLCRTAVAELEFSTSSRSAITVKAVDVPSGLRVQPGQFMVSPDGVTSVRVECAPETAGERRTEIRFESDGQVLTVPVSFAAADSEIAAPSLVDFGTVVIGDIATRALSIANKAPAPADVTSELGGPNVGQFVVARRSWIQANDQIDLPITFIPSARGPLTATVSLRSCSHAAPVEVLLQGTGASAEIRYGPAKLEFGAVTPGMERTLEVEVENVGDVPATIEGIALDPQGSPFSVDAAPFPLALPQGAVAHIAVRFAPVAEGSFESVLAISTPRSAISVPLSGRGGGPDLFAEPGALDFGTIAVGATMKLPLSISDRGSGDPVRVNDIHVEGAGNGAFGPGSSGLALPAYVTSSEPLEIEVEFRAGAAGEHRAYLVVVTSDLDTPELRISLLGRAEDVPLCQLETRPAELRFGLVHAGERHERTAALVNLSPHGCRIFSLALDPQTNGAFTLASPPTVPTTLPPGGQLNVTVAFTPTVPSTAVERTRLVFSYAAPSPFGEIPVTGFASELDLEVVPSPVDFGSSSLAFRPLRSFTLTNAGALAAIVSQMRFAAISNPAFRFFGSPYAGYLDAGTSRTSTLEFAPSLAGPAVGTLEIALDGVIEPLLVPLKAEALDVPCGDYCLPPVAQCPAAQTTLANRPVTLAGVGTQVMGDPVECSWAVIDRPVGSSAQPAALAACTTTFVPDFVGHYTLELTVTSHMGGVGRCRVDVDASAHPGLWLETYWNVPTDIDLHLLHPAAGPCSLASSWFGNMYDCYFAVDAPDWDAPGPQDDPSLDRDDIVGTGPENILLHQPTINTAYAVGVHWWNKNQPSQPQVDVVTNVYCGGNRKIQVATTLTQRNELVALGTVTFDSSGNCTWVPVNLRFYQQPAVP